MPDLQHILSDYLDKAPKPIGYAILFLSGGIEYVAPPLPGDMIALFGVFLSLTSGYAPVLVYVALTAGSTCGGLVSYGVGLFLKHHPAQWPAFMRGPKWQGRLRLLEQRYARRGAVYLSINRFVPAFRSLFFLAAGIAELSPQKVIVFGGLSAALWNALLFGLAYAVEANLDVMTQVFTQYSSVALAGLALIVVVFLPLRWLWQRKRKTKAS